MDRERVRRCRGGVTRTGNSRYYPLSFLLVRPPVVGVQEKPGYHSYCRRGDIPILGSFLFVRPSPSFCSGVVYDIPLRPESSPGDLYRASVELPVVGTERSLCVRSPPVSTKIVVASDLRVCVSVRQIKRGSPCSTGASTVVPCILITSSGTQGQFSRVVGCEGLDSGRGDGKGGPTTYSRTPARDDL